MDQRCPYCHEHIPAREFARHVADHETLRDDGQQTDHVTLPPEERAEGDLSDVPRVYHHARCGVQTVMPEEIVRSYLVNPFLYNGGTFCCGCNGYVTMAEVRWVETGQRLSDYFDDLQTEAILDGRGPSLLAEVGPICAVILLACVGAGAGIGKGQGNPLLGGVLGAVVGLVVAGVAFVVLWARRTQRINRLLARDRKQPDND